MASAAGVNKYGASKRGARLALFALLLAAARPHAQAQTQAQDAVRPQPLKSGLEFTGADARALQQDDFANPGMLWVARGEKLWSEVTGSAGKSCASCHGDAGKTMKGVSAGYPKLDAGGELLNLEGRINQCRADRQHAAPLKYESDDLLGLTAYVANQSRGMPIKVELNAANRAHFEAGREMYYRRQGQLNLACAHCHEKNWGRQLGAETISQGHGNDYPIYRLEWQSAGSLHRRFRSCLFGVRAELLPQGSPQFLDLELFLAWRESGLLVETPGVRR
jgi:sulfur-oxidizing protein SoxA